MPHDLLLFDLDGTLSDPLEGIGRSINFSLIHFG
jgi:phosphoglycolate phosphatase